MIPERFRSEPLLRVEKDSKKPVEDNYAVAEIDEIENWVEGGGNVGISLAHTDLVVIDIDTEEVAEEVLRLFPSTFSVETGSGWYHRYYCCPEWDRNVCLGGDSSIRSDGWMAVVPPSTHPDGGQYSVHRESPIPVVDAWRLDELVREFGQDSEGDHPSSRRDRGDDLDDLDELIQHDGYRSEAREVLEDCRAEHDCRVSLAGFLLDAVGLSASETVQLIHRHNCWDNYDREITRKQVRSVASSAGGGR